MIGQKRATATFFGQSQTTNTLALNVRMLGGCKKQLESSETSGNALKLH